MLTPEGSLCPFPQRVIITACVYEFSQPAKMAKKKLPKHFRSSPDFSFHLVGLPQWELDSVTLRNEQNSKQHNKTWERKHVKCKEPKFRRLKREIYCKSAAFFCIGVTELDICCHVTSHLRNNMVRSRTDILSPRIKMNIDNVYYCRLITNQQQVLRDFLLLRQQDFTRITVPVPKTP